MANGSTLGKAYVQILPSADGIKGSITNLMKGESESAGESSGASFTSRFVSVAKKLIAGAAIGKAISASITAGGALEQAIGGIETLYKDASDTMIKYADNAFKTAGLSANDYMQTATSFAAGLVSSLGGNTAKAAEAANTAITDMSDNANKMGTSMESIQNAYQGFAKQNYTMLDNLKLGYGGTKTEMERLLSDAEKMPEAMGRDFDLSNYADVVEAIHIVQKNMDISGYSVDELNQKLKDHALTEDEVKKVAEDMGISYEEAMQKMNDGSLTAKDASALLGTTAKEAATTIEGSINMMKSSFTNLLADLALNRNVSDAMNSLVESTVIAGQNVGNALLNIVATLPGAVVTMVSAIGTQITANWGVITSAVSTGIENVKSFLNEKLPDFVDKGFEILTSVGQGIINNIPGILENIGEVVTSLVQYLFEHLPEFLEKGAEFISSMIEGIANNMPEIVSAISTTVSSLISYIMQHLPEFLKKGIEIIGRLASGILQNLPTIIGGMAQVLASVVRTIIQHLPQFLSQGIALIGRLATGLIQAIPQVISAAGRIILQLFNAFTNRDWGSIGKNLMRGIANGISGMISSVVQSARNAASRIWDSITGFFGIHSPSVKMAWAGRMLDEGLAKGIGSSTSIIDDAIDSLNDSVNGGINANISTMVGTAGGDVAGSSVTNSADTYSTTINVYASDGMDEKTLAEKVGDIIDDKIKRDKEVFA